MTDPIPTPGERIAFYRKRRALSQVELGRLIGRSESWVSQVERNARKIDRLSVLTQVAAVLGVATSDLAPDAPVTLAPIEQAPWRDSLRLAITGHPALAAVFGSTVAAVSAGNLNLRADEAWSLVHGSRYADAGPVLVDLIGDIESAARTESQTSPATFKALSITYQATSALFSKIDDVEAAWIAADRAIFAAEMSEDPVLVAASQYRLAQTLLSSGRLAQAQHAADVGATTLTSGLSGYGIESTSILGALNLVKANSSARLGDRSTAWRAIETAERLAAVVGPGRNDFNTEFGPANVAAHAVGVAVVLGDAGEALDRAAGVDTSGLSPERRGRYLVDVASAHAQRRARGEAVTALLDAEQIAPEQIRDHRVVRTLIRDLLQDASLRSDQALRALADRCGVPI